MGTLTTEYRWLLPAALVADLEETRPPRRSTRDWIIDTVCFLLGFGFTVLTTWDLLQPHQVIVPEWGYTPDWLVWTDFAAAPWPRSRSGGGAAIHCTWPCCWC